MSSILEKICFILDARQKRQAGVLLVLIAVGAALEVVSVGLIVPFMRLVGDPEAALKMPAVQGAYNYFHFASLRSFVLFSGGGLLAAYLLKNIYQALVYDFQYRFTTGGQVSVARRLYAAYLNSPYVFHVQSNSATLLRNLTAEVKGLFEGVIFSAMTILTEIMILAFLMGFLVYMEPFVSLVSLFVLCLTGGLFYLFIHRTLRGLGQDYQFYNGRQIQSIQQGLGGVKEVKVLGREDHFLADFEALGSRFARASRIYGVAAQMPRLMIEVLIIGGFLSVVLIMLSRDADIRTSLPTLSLFAVAMVRLIPSMNRIMSNMTALRFYTPAIDVVYRDMKGLGNLAGSGSVSKRSSSGEGSAPSIERIEFDGVSYHYPSRDRRAALRDVSFSVMRGESVGITGPSGAGKTTLLDVLLGLLPPTKGAVLADGRDIHDDLGLWRRSIGYVPQTIYLMDDTVRRNIAFGLPAEEIDEKRLQEAVAAANLSAVIEGLPQGLEARIGERGVQLSGGQCQRIGIARALYHNPSILILDEATSSLDPENESIITDAIDALAGRKTLFIVSHRLATVRRCGRRFQLQDGRLSEVKSFSGAVDQIG